MSAIEDLQGRVGTVLGPSAWREGNQEDIDAFAALSGDRQWIHTDVERARRESPFGTTIAHGNLTLAMIDGWRDELVDVKGFRLGVNLGYDRVRFPAPVITGTTVQATVTLTDVVERPDGWWQLLQLFTVTAEGQ